MSSSVPWSLPQILDTFAEVQSVLEQDKQSRKIGRLNVGAIDASDREIRQLALWAEQCDLDLAGIPLWRNPHGEVVGKSPRMRERHLLWLIADVRYRIDFNNPLALLGMGKARANSCAVSPNVCSLMARMTDDAELAEVQAGFAELRSA